MLSVPLLTLAGLAALAAPVLAQGGGISTERVDLYQGDPHVVHLDNVTFYGALLDKPHAWAMEFYMDWCGHCQRFAPIWSEVARRAKDWGTVIKVGAINCARRRNSAICRTFGIHGVPQVRLFGPRVRRGMPGLSGIQHDPDRMVGVLIEFVTTIQRRQQPEGWPTLTEHRGSARQLLRNPEPLQALILEEVGRSMGRSVQLDLSSQQHLVRVSRTAHLPADLTQKPSSLPALVLMRPDGSQELVTAKPGQDPRVLFSAVIRRNIGLMDIPSTTVAPTVAPAPTPAPTRAPADRVFMVDMENAIVVALKQEVISHNVIEGEALEALRGFLRMLLDLFPGRSHLMSSLQQVLGSITGPERISGEALERLLKSSSPWWPGLPELQPYQACRGSRPNYRGYSCGLWTLFHSLTVQELRNVPEGRNATVLPAVHGYVKHFFSCRHCSRHFQQMAAEDGLFNVSSTEDSLLWLWRAHNKVNGRIAGDVTEDPLHPKRQFPDRKLCPYCFVGDQCDTYEVIDFLLQFYAAEKFHGHSEVVPGIMRFPSEMLHVLPTVVRASPAEESEITPGLGTGRSRTQRRVTYTRPRVVVRVRPGPATSALTPSASAVRSIVAPLTASPVTLVESVAHVLRRLQNGGGPEDSERLERDRLVKVAEMMAAESGSTDESTDEDDVRDLASQLTSRKEVVRLSQKMVDQATPPPPCAAKKHNLDSEHLTLTEVSRELRRRYDAANDLLSTSASAGVGATPSGTSTTPGGTSTTPGTSATSCLLVPTILESPKRYLYTLMTRRKRLTVRKDSEDEGDSVEELPDASSAQRGDASVDSITNCNVVNAVGQNRRLEKQRARGLPPGGDKENRAPAGGVKDEGFYAQFPLMKEVAHKGDLIAFKCWDMAADYSPFVSEYREATVMETGDGGQYRPRGRRRGRFEITSPDDDEVVDLEEESGIEERCWSELIQPRLLHP
ncbi:Sulfhydryl oxidase 1 [Amphibalanus amphitrite]|uniref:Sulfhydryl oxidase n=1 Tax=Amphibalanus amphitrite TaxID=1232801 RepID=A0A6A4WML7_AMPAM|nr:Sulfhydryl oxidase 1 [Amphibalanus amphitrite]